MNNQTLEALRHTLLARRTALLTRWRQALSDENELLAVREPDWEDTAATTTAIVVLDGIGEQERRALARIQSSLARIERGNYGECVACHETIDEQRLRAVPDTDRCVGCAPRLN
jgi:DnaK suppressor protein